MSEAKYLTFTEFSKALDVTPASITNAAKSRNGNPSLLHPVKIDGKRKIDLTCTLTKKYINDLRTKGKTFSIERAFGIRETRNTKHLIDHPDISKPIESDKLDYNEEKRKLECINLTEQIKQKKLQNAKLSGILIPVDETQYVINYSFTNFYGAFQSHFRNELGLVVRELGGNDDQYKTFLARQEEEFRKILFETREEFRDSLQKIVEDYKEVRSRGEKK